MSITNTLTGPTVGIMGVPQEFLCSLSAPSVGNDVITISSSNGSDTFSASPGGPVTSTVTIPNGSPIAATVSNAPSSTSVAPQIGNDPNGANRSWTGQLDEIRISATNRSPSWISASYSNQLAPGTFIQPPGGQGPISLGTISPSTGAPWLWA